MSELKIETVLISSLTPDPANARKHDSKNLDAIANSLRLFGQRKPLTVTPDSIVVTGNGTLEAAKQMGWTEIAIARTPVGWSYEQIRAWALADNRTAELAEWDSKILADQLLELDANGWELDELGFESLEPPVNLDDEEPLNFDDVPTRAKLGDVWELGKHRLICGDSTDKATVFKLMNGQSADMIFTDPPYNADYSSRVDKNRRKAWGGILNDNMTTENFGNFIFDSISQGKSVLKNNGAIYCWTDWKRYPLVASIFSELFNHKSTIVWDKSHFGLGTYYRTQYELVLFGVNGDKVETWNAGHDEKDVWTQSRVPTSQYVHPTQKPVELAIRAIKNSTDKNQNVLDLFAGSGSTLIACEKINRNCFLLELDERYCDVILKSWENLTGKTAELLES